ncbi:MAG: hypothetical protein U5J62_06455 [Desulfurivibrio sp.]|nr:hypothetical protein [Desulfurivibrio sp.]
MPTKSKEELKIIYLEILRNPAFREVTDLREVNSSDQFSPERALAASRAGRKSSRRAMAELEESL